MNTSFPLPYGMTVHNLPLEGVWWCIYFHFTDNGVALSFAQQQGGLKSESPRGNIRSFCFDYEVRGPLKEYDKHGAVREWTGIRQRLEWQSAFKAHRWPDPIGVACSPTIEFEDFPMPAKIVMEAMPC